MLEARKHRKRRLNLMEKKVQRRNQNFLNLWLSFRLEARSSVLYNCPQQCQQQNSDMAWNPSRIVTETRKLLIFWMKPCSALNALATPLHGISVPLYNGSGFSQTASRSHGYS